MEPHRRCILFVLVQPPTQALPLPATVPLIPQDAHSQDQLTKGNFLMQQSHLQNRGLDLAPVSPLPILKNHIQQKL